MKKITKGFHSAIASTACKITKFNVNSTCFYIANQPELPKSALKLKHCLKND